MIQDLTAPPIEPLTVIKPREFNIKQKNEPKKEQAIAGAKPNFNPPKTNYDLALEQEKKHKAISLFEGMDDLGSIKPKTSPQPVTENKEEKQNENLNKKDDKQKDQQIQTKNESNTQKQNAEQTKKEQHIHNNQNEKKDMIIKENPDKKDSFIPEEKKPVMEIKNPVKENVEEKPVEVLKTPSLEEIKKQEEEAIKVQEQIEAKIQEQILNEEKERKRLVATRIFNTYNENIDYCDEVFDFKYD